MVKYFITAALATATVMAAAPAAAQWAQPVPQGYAYGYNNNNYGQVRRLEARIDQIKRQVRELDRRNILSNREGRRLSEEARALDRRVNVLARNGFNNRDRYDIERRIAILEQRVRREATDGNRRNGYGNGYNNVPFDRDRDGRDDRYEDDRGRIRG